MQIIDDKALLLKLRNPQRVLNTIPKSKLLDDGHVLVHWGLDEARVLKNIGIKGVPSPIEGRYKWPGLYKPFDHQRTTASFMTLHKRAFCFNDPGTGKTAAFAWAADYLMNKGYIKRALVICPLSIMSSAWQADLFKVVMHRRVDVAYGDRRKRAKIIQSDAEFVIINFDGVQTVLEELKAGGFDLVIIDEANAVKTATTNRWKALNELITSDTWLWMATGTPASQAPTDAYGLAKMLNPDSPPKLSTGYSNPPSASPRKSALIYQSFYTPHGR
jgi:SNF2 family DNA or RNA helicase